MRGTGGLEERENEPKGKRKNRPRGTVRGKGEWTVRVRNKKRGADEVGSWKETSPKPE
jgi:hypothetical protein